MKKAGACAPAFFPQEEETACGKNLSAAPAAVNVDASAVAGVIENRLRGTRRHPNTPGGSRITREMARMHTIGAAAETHPERHLHSVDRGNFSGANLLRNVKTTTWSPFPGTSGGNGGIDRNLAVNEEIATLIRNINDDAGVFAVALREDHGIDPGSAGMTLNRGLGTEIALECAAVAICRRGIASARWSA